MRSDLDKKINTNKSSITFSSKTPHEVKIQAKQILGIQKERGVGKYLVLGKKYSGIEFLQTPGKTPASGSPLEGPPVPRIPARRNPGSLLWSFPGPVPGSPLSSRKWKTSDKGNLPYFRIWKSLGRLYKGNLNPKARDRHFETKRLELGG